jgi:hypothetical protein
MKPSVTRIVAIASVTIVAFDCLAAFASRRIGFGYANAAWGSLIIQAATGFVAARATGRVATGAWAAALVGLVEATVGWWLSMLIGPSGVSDVARGPSEVAFTIVLVVAIAAGLGALAGTVGRRAAVIEPPAP